MELTAAVGRCHVFAMTRSNHPLARKYQKANKRYISGTDPDAVIVWYGKPKLFYQVHRAVEEQHEIIPATKVTPGDVMWVDLLKRHEDNTDPPPRRW